VSYIVDCKFPIHGEFIPVDHGFSMFGAISRILPEFHESTSILLGPIRGFYVENGLLRLEKYSSLSFRLKSDEIQVVLRLAGKCINIDGHRVKIGIPKVSLLQETNTLFSSFVTTKNGNLQERFEAEIQRQIDSLCVKADLNVLERRTLTIHQKKIVGYSLNLTNLSGEDSILIQENGLGGRKKMACGFFWPKGID
jgi:CRISPR-associated protein Cas6